MKSIPIGTILQFAGSSSEAAKLRRQGWMLCDGRELCSSDYRELFSRIGFEWGAAQQKNHFRLPDFRGSVLSAGVFCGYFNSVNFHRAKQKAGDNSPTVNSPVHFIIKVA